MMNLRISDVLPKSKKTFTLRRPATLVGGLLALTLLLAGTQAEAQPAHFHYVGGRWSHTRHVGWHRYWGGPSIGFYYAPTPVYVVPGYAAPSYYAGPDFWTSNPAFGITLNLGGGGGYYTDGGYYGGSHYYHRDRYYSGGRYHTDARYHGAPHAFSGGVRPSGGHFYGGGGHFSGGGGRVSGGGGHFSGGGRDRR